MPKSRNRRRSSSNSRPKSRPSGRARQPREPLVAQPAPGLRGQVERASAPALLRLSSLPAFVLPVLSVVLLVAGLAAPPGLGAPVLLLLIAVIAWLSYLSWPAVHGVQRLLRVGVVALLVVALVLRFTG